MKARPRRIENRAAAELNRVFGADIFKRLPVIGRACPDLTFPNPIGIAVDVKSRKEIPAGIFRIEHGIWQCGDFIVVRLNFIRDVGASRAAEVEYASDIVWNYLNHVRLWTLENGGFPVVFLHRPRTPVNRSLLVMNEDGLEGIARYLSAITQQEET